MPNTDHKINILQQINKIIVDPPKKIIVKAHTGVRAHYFTQADSDALVDVQTKNMGPRVRLPTNSTMDSEQVGHLNLTILPAAT